MNEFANKPGLALESLIPEWAVANKKGCQCADYARRMDRAGTEKCDAQKDKIVARLMSQRDRLAWPLNQCPMSVAEPVVRMMVSKAIRMSQFDDASCQ